MDDLRPIRKAFLRVSDSTSDGRAAALVRVLGLSLLERNLLALQAVGVDRVYMDGGPHSAKIREALSSNRRLAMEMEWVAATDDQGHSKDAAVRLSDQPFFLLDARLQYDTQILESLAVLPIARGEVILSTDTLGHGGPGDPYVRFGLDTERIEAAGAGIADPHAVDTGIWMCGPETSSAVLEGDLDALAQNARLSGHSVENRFWVRVDSETARCGATQGLLHGLIKPTDGFVSRHFNRKISLLLSRGLIRTSVTPNQISIFTLLISLLAAWWIASGHHLWVALGGLAFQFASILDGSDGEIAKLKLLQSPTGEWVDTVADDISFVAFFASLVWGAYEQLQEFYVLALGGAAVLLIPLIFLVIHRFLKRAGTRSQVGFVTSFGSAVSNGRRNGFHRISDALKFAARRDFFSAFFCVFLLFDGLVVSFWIFTVGVFWFALAVFIFAGSMMRKINS